MITIYHNPRCGKSRECIAFMEASGEKFEIIKYLETPFNHKSLSEFIQKLNLEPIELIRKKEKIWIEQFKNMTLNDDELIEVMVQNPILIERPIVVKANKAVIARPLQQINTFL
jgi:arsenate reductase